VNLEEGEPKVKTGRVFDQGAVEPVEPAPIVNGLDMFEDLPPDLAFGLPHFAVDTPATDEGMLA
jgi:hypothetical protein